MGALTAQTISTQIENAPPIPQIVEFYLAIDGKQQGAFAADVIEKKFANGEITENTLVWKKGLKQWVKLGEMEDFQHLFDGSSPPPIPTM